MKDLVRREMEAGALGIGTALIYPPGTFATTEELIALCKVAAEVQGQVHLAHAERGRPPARGDRRGDPDFAGRPDVPAEIYHFKAAGEDNWGKVDAAIAKIEAARREGLKITADMYTYTAGGDEPRLLHSAVGARGRDAGAHEAPRRTPRRAPASPAR